MKERNMKTAMSAAIVAFAVFASGCMGVGSADDKAENQSPDAKLDTNGMNKGWSTQEFRFDGRDSTDPDGNITSWRFDFGDKTPPMEVNRKEEADVRHTYARGGEYTVTLTVFDNGEERQGAKSDQAAVTIAVNEKILVPGGVVHAQSPANGTTVVKQKYAFPFNVNEDADRYQLELDFQSPPGTIGESEIVLRVKDAEGDISKEQTVRVPQGGQTPVNLEDTINADQDGNWTIEVEAIRGGAAFEGDLEVYYDAGY